MTVGAQTRVAAITALASLIDTARQAKDDAALLKFRGDYPGQPAPNYPVDGSVLPNCIVDTAFDYPPNPGKIVRGLGVSSGNVHLLNSYFPDGVEATHSFLIEWLVMSPNEQDADRLSVFNAGIAEIEKVLCDNPVLPDVDGDPTVVAFEITDLDLVVQNFGEIQSNAAFINLSLVLDAATVLS